MNTYDGRRTRSRKKGKKKINVLQSLFFILLLITVGYVLLKSPVFAIDTVEIEGTHNIDKSIIEEMSGIVKGTNIFKIDLNRSIQAISTYPIVKEVQVDRRLPSTIEIYIIERKAVGIIPIGGSFWEFDEEGVLLGQVTSEKATSLPIITGIDYEVVAPGARLSGKSIQSAIACVLALEHTMLSKISEINVTDPYNILVYTLDGVQVRLGNCKDVKEKLSLVNKVISKQQEKLEYIDISVTGSPVLKSAEE